MSWFSKEIFRKALVSQLCYVILFLGACKEKTALLQSPLGEIVIKAGLKEGIVYYNVSYGDIQILDWSQLGVILPDSVLGGNLYIKTINYSVANDIWKLLGSEDEKIINSYNQMVISVEEQGEAKRKFDIVFRAFEGGYGFRYEFPIQNHLTTFMVINESTEFNFTANHKIGAKSYEVECGEIEYQFRFLNKQDTLCTPLIIETREGLYLTVFETNPADYATMYLTSLNGETTLKSYLIQGTIGEKIFMKTPAVTPWRIMTITDNQKPSLINIPVH